MEKNKEEFALKCVTLLEGGAKDWGKHILMPNHVTLCGMPTPEAVKYHPELNKKFWDALIVPFREEKWEITCEKCLEMYEIFKNIRKEIN